MAEYRIANKTAGIFAEAKGYGLEFIHNYCEPLYRGKALSASHRDTVDEFLITELDNTGLDSLEELNSNDGIFNILNEKNVLNPRTFWKLAVRKHPNLSKLAIRLLQIPASSAQLERLFSNWSYIHSDRRNRLQMETSKKLVHTYYSSKLNYKNDDNVLSEED